MSKSNQQSPERQETVIYLDLDSLLDTRLGTLAKESTQLATKALDSGGYFSRVSDTFPGLTKEEFETLYDKRDVETLKHSLITNVSFFLQRLVKDALAAAAVSDSKGDALTLVLNIHPYILADEEVEMLVGCVRHVTYSACGISVVSLPAQEMTLEQCKNNYDIMVMYDYEKFIVAHEAKFAECRMPNVSLVAPEMFKAKVPSKEEMAELKMAQYNPFRITERSLAVAIGLKLMPISLFCINERLTKEDKNLLLKRISYTEEQIMEAIEVTGGAKIELVDPLPVVPPIDRNLESEDDYDLL